MAKKKVPRTAQDTQPIKETRPPRVRPSTGHGSVIHGNDRGNPQIQDDYCGWGDGTSTTEAF